MTSENNDIELYLTNNSEEEHASTVNKAIVNPTGALAARVAEISDSQLTKYQAIRKFPKASICVVIMVWSLILTSFESQAGGIVISIAQFRKKFGELQLDGSYVIAAKWQSCFSGLPLAAQIIGQFISSELVDRFGKKYVIIISILISFAFVGMEFAAVHVQLFLAGKTMNGLMLGIMQPASVSYVTDVAPLVLRGMATSLCNIAFSIGPLICFIINYSLSGKDEDDAWAYRAIFTAQWGFAVVALIFLVWVPESPTYLIMKERYDDARISYKKLLDDDVAVEEQLGVVTMTINEAKAISENASYLDLFKGLNFKRTMVSIMPFLIQPFSGVYFTGNYTTYYFELIGYDDAKSFKFTCGAQAISIGGCLLSLWLVDKVGRRNGYIGGLAALIIVDFIIGGTGTATSNPKSLQTTVAFLMLYGGVYNACVGSMAYTIATENPTSALRAKTIATALLSTNAINMMWSFVLPYIFNPNHGNLGAKTMFIFAAISVVFLVYLIFFQTETKGRTYDEVDELYASRVPLRKFEGFVTRTSALNTENKEFNEKAEQEHIEGGGVLEGTSANQK